MATRGLIAIELKDSSVLSSYHHYDSYPSGLGALLIEHYNRREKLLEAVDLGDASFWGENIHPSTTTHSFDNREEGVSVYYGRDRGEKNTEAKEHDSIDAWVDYVKSAGVDYGYLLTKDNLWVMVSVHERKIDWDAEDALLKAA